MIKALEKRYFRSSMVKPFLSLPGINLKGLEGLGVIVVWLSDW